MIVQALRQLAVLLLLAVAPAFVSGALQLQRTDALLEDEVAASEVQQWGDQVQWVDARPREKFDAGHLAGAVLLNEDEWDALVPEFLNAWEPDRIVVVYCDGGSCEASHAVARRLREDLKLENIRVLKGGLEAWPQK